jgi:hypothetical protein
MLEPLGDTAPSTQADVLLKLKDLPGGAISETYNTPGCAAASMIRRTAKEKIRRYDLGPALSTPHKNDSMDVSNSFSLIFGF